MAERICISREGVFEIDGRSYRIPEYFSTREVLSYRTLLEPIPDVEGGKSLTAKGRVAAQAVTGNPLQEIELLRAVDFVIKAGVVYKSDGVPRI